MGFHKALRNTGVGKSLSECCWLLNLNVQLNVKLSEHQGVPIQSSHYRMEFKISRRVAEKEIT